MLQIIVLRFAVNRFRVTIEGGFTIGNNYSLSDEGILNLNVNSVRPLKEHTVEQTANKRHCYRFLLNSRSSLYSLVFVSSSIFYFLFFFQLFQVISSNVHDFR